MRWKGIRFDRGWLRSEGPQDSAVKASSRKRIESLTTDPLTPDYFGGCCGGVCCTEGVCPGTGVIAGFFAAGLFFVAGFFAGSVSSTTVFFGGVAGIAAWAALK